MVLKTQLIRRFVLVVKFITEVVMLLYNFNKRTLYVVIVRYFVIYIISYRILELNKNFKCVVLF